MTSNLQSYLLGKGTYGVITSKVGESTCRKIFSKDKFSSFVREAYIIKKLSYIKGITEVISIEHPDVNDSKMISEVTRGPAWGVIVMNKYAMTLKEWLKTNPSYSERLTVLSEIIRILSEVHAAGIVHADIKLENVMLTGNNEVRMIDWGLSGPCGYARIHLTTKTYRPKQIIQDYCHDIYSLGVLSVELLLGSMMVNDLDYAACIKLVKSTNIDLSLKRLLCRMIHPNCLHRPDIVEISKEFLLPLPVNINSDVNEIVTIPHEYGIVTAEYPIIFNKFTVKHPDMAPTLYCIIGSIYDSKNPYYLRMMIEYDHVIKFINFQ
jgi:serine/threonine protein kinase